MELARAEKIGHGKPARPSTHEALRAEDADEPQEAMRAQMLDALGPEEAQFYSREERAVERVELRSRVIFEDLQEKFGFVSGRRGECERYFGRRDLPPNLWHFGGLEEVKAIAGFRAAGKKSGDRPRGSP